ncbi:NADP-dependent oxidoreductase [Rothia halotolerans]|uniref:NADP-dependent oxidoreductase n=1 Tax=Rothia halotolerans TaxID=405770 RepID=UPI00101B753F|nr:NADP-dependent oxidoreductase [Rothia halotolerans]
MTVSTQIQLASRPEGWPSGENFSTVRVELPDLSDGEVRVRNEAVSVDPYMRGRMVDAESYVEPFKVGETMTGGAVGRVVESASDDLPVGTPVLHQYGWRDVAQGPAERFRAVREAEGMPLSLYLGVLGMTGMTAYMGLTRAAGIREGDTVFVSGAAGAVGTAVSQIARLLGAGRVLGSAGSQEKIDLITGKYGYDDAVNYKDAPIREQLPRMAGEGGVDLYFDNVGGDHLEAALDVLNRNGRVAVCGAISQYNDTEATPGPDNMNRIITNSLKLQGFTVGDYMQHAEEFNQKMIGWFSEGRIAYDETVVEGIENAPEAFISMMRGANQGKMIVRV